MGFAIYPLTVLSFFIGMLALQSYSAQQVLPPSSTIKTNQVGQQFIAYRNAIALYLQNNPAFLGTVTAAALAAQGTPFNAIFLASVGNAITATGISGRVITCYGDLGPGGLASATQFSDNDASLGLASGANWTSIAAGSTAQPLTTAVPSGNAVSVVQIGS